MADKPDERCYEEESDDGTMAYEGCPDACGLCAEEVCEDDAAWYKAGKPDKVS